MARILVIEDEVSARGAAVIAISGALPDLLPQAKRRATVTLRKPFNSWELIEAVERSCSAAPPEKSVA